jgi:hypothetical protein
MWSRTRVRILGHDPPWSRERRGAWRRRSNVELLARAANSHSVIINDNRISPAVSGGVRELGIEETRDRYVEHWRRPVSEDLGKRRRAHRCDRTECRYGRETAATNRAARIDLLHAIPTTKLGHHWRAHAITLTAQTISFETDAEQLKASGIKIGADARSFDENMMDGLLAPFPIDSRVAALKMARLYALLHCFENSIRDLVSERLLEKHGENWWQNAVSAKIQKYAADVRQKAIEQSWLDGDKGAMIDFVTLGHLTDIMVNSWSDFEEILPGQDWLRQRMNEIENIRNFAAHGRVIGEREYNRVLMYIEDWRMQIGL